MNRRIPAPPDDLWLDVFVTDKRGAAILAHLEDNFGALPSVTTGGIDAILKTYSNEGSRRVVNYILAKINAAQFPSEGTPEVRVVTMDADMRRALDESSRRE